MKKNIININRGVTLVELLVTLAISTIVVAGVFSIVTFSGTKTSQINALQQLQQESSLISELFTRNVRNAAFVAAGTGTTAPLVQTNANSITTRATDGTIVSQFSFANNQFIMNGNPVLTSYRCAVAGPPASGFIIFPNGTYVQLNLSLSTVINNENVNYTITVGGVRCRNAVGS